MVYDSGYKTRMCYITMTNNNVKSENINVNRDILDQMTPHVHFQNVGWKIATSHKYEFRELSF